MPGEQSFSSPEKVLLIAQNLVGDTVAESKNNF